MARSSEGFDCKGGACHQRGTMQSYEIHHVWPQGMHGPDEAWNKVKICSNAHSNTHDLLNRMLRGKTYVESSYSVTERKLAARGYAAVMAYAEGLSAELEKGNI